MTRIPPFVCPRCKAPLSREARDAYRCRACERRYPIVMGIPDFRLFPDPYISIEDDYRKAETLARYYDELSFPQLVARYWEMTPGVAEDLVREYTRSAIRKRDRSLKTWQEIRPAGAFGGGGALLEVGCGTAGFLAATAPSFAGGVGLDIAFRWLVVARKRLQELGVSNVTLVCGCAEHLPFPDGSFDLVVAEDVLDHTRDQESFAREGGRVLRRQTGVLYLSTPNRYSLGPDPHVWVWGVGFLPPRFRDAYVRWRKGVPFGPIRPVSYARLKRLLRNASLSAYRVAWPELGVLGLSPWHRAQARVYELTRRLPLIRRLLRLVGPSFQVFCRPMVRDDAASPGCKSAYVPSRHGKKSCEAR